MNQIVHTLQLDGLSLAPLTPTIGAEVSGVDLAQPLSAANKAALRQALLDWKVIFFRDQEITTDQHLAFARNFGDLEVHPFGPSKPGYPGVIPIDHDRKRRARTNVWHSDVTFRLEPPLGSILRAIEAPPVGGDTLFADMYAAYEGLSDEIKAEIDGAVAVHDFRKQREDLRRQGKSEAEIEELKRAYPIQKHPVVRTHPETGRKALYVNWVFTVEIEGMDRARSDTLLAHLYAQASIPEYQCRFRWTPNSIAFWDNRAAQHYAASDYWPAVRRMERITIMGDRPR